MDAVARRRTPLSAAVRLLLGLAVSGLAGANLAAGAVLQLPTSSPRASVSQWVGLTHVTVNYHSPAVAGRPIWGSVVVPGRVWLVGDAGASTISFSREVVVDGATVPAGTYALLAVPSATEWTLILNRETRLWRAADRDPALDVVQIKAPAEPAPFRERLTFVFSEFTDQRAILELGWERVRVRIPIELKTDEQVRAALQSLDDTWRRYADAARCILEKKGDLDAGLTYVNQSLALRETWYGTWIKASLLAARGDYARAREQAARAYQLGQAAGEFALELQVKEALAAWSARAIQRPPREQARRRREAHLQAARIARVPTGPEKTEVIDTDLEPFPAVAERAVEVPRATARKPPSPAEFSPLIKRGLPDLQRCYQRALRQDPSLAAAKVTLSIAVGVSGRVTSVAVDPSLPARTLEACVKDAVGRWAFPSSPVEYETQVPLVLSGHN